MASGRVSLSHSVGQKASSHTLRQALWGPAALGEPLTTPQNTGTGAGQGNPRPGQKESPKTRSERCTGAGGGWERRDAQPASPPPAGSGPSGAEAGPAGRKPPNCGGRAGQSRPQRRQEENNPAPGQLNTHFLAPPSVSRRRELHEAPAAPSCRPTSRRVQSREQGPQNELVPG